MNKKVTFKISMTGLAIALIIIAQLFGKLLPTGFTFFGPFSVNQLITGSIVNLILVLLTIEIGIYYSAVAGILSSVMAMILQIGPIFPQLVVFIALSNIILVSVVYYLRLIDKFINKNVALIISVVVAAFIKFIFLKFTIPLSFNMISGISEVQIKVLSVMFSWPQLITALIGGFIALSVNKMLEIKNIDYK